jgi:hypothetical protein
MTDASGDPYIETATQEDRVNTLASLNLSALADIAVNWKLNGFANRVRSSQSRSLQFRALALRQTAANACQIESELIHLTCRGSLSPLSHSVSPKIDPSVDRCDEAAHPNTGTT